MKQKEKRILQLATLAGRILIEAEAEGYRVERTVKQILEKSHLDYSDVFSTASGLFLTLDKRGNDEEDTNEGTTLVVRVNQRKNHIQKIHYVNDITYQFIADTMSVEEAIDALKSIKDIEYTAHNNFIATIILVMAYIILLGGGPGDLVLSLIPSAVLLFFELSEDDFGLNSFSVNVLTTTSLSFVLPLITEFVTDDFNFNIVIAATLMPLYPGTAFTYAIRDMLKNDYSTAITRAVDAIMKALSLALGVAVGLALSYGVINLWN
ncbi:threonine/serine exporter family protein [Facklamia sp. DSM 111018]|uniref:Threonine/serine exporter family protein n=1 Tax=Facklamia lactis TaxID=2749967 RepID=A0ABS0LQ27_9LACT|nr:threonine/serine exporter family protein [Facklamia lactis]MBG9980306.1 threonine/serine exporter family protein [Facklamia lactis]MBG9986109.1 threonine/serine exporter family protein [Facklamia lactis]